MAEDDTEGEAEELEDMNSEAQEEEAKSGNREEGKVSRSTLNDCLLVSSSSLCGNLCEESGGANSVSKGGGL